MLCNPPASRGAGGSRFPRSVPFLSLSSVTQFTERITNKCGTHACGGGVPFVSTIESFVYPVILPSRQHDSETRLCKIGIHRCFVMVASPGEWGSWGNGKLHGKSEVVRSVAFLCYVSSVLERLRFGWGVGAMCASNRYATRFYVVPFVFRRYRRTITDSPTDFIKRIRFIVLLSCIPLSPFSALMDAQNDGCVAANEWMNFPKGKRAPALDSSGSMRWKKYNSFMIISKYPSFRVNASMKNSESKNVGATSFSLTVEFVMDWGLRSGGAAAHAFVSILRSDQHTITTHRKFFNSDHSPKFAEWNVYLIYSQDWRPLVHTHIPLAAEAGSRGDVLSGTRITHK